MLFDFIIYLTSLLVGGISTAFDGICILIALHLYRKVDRDDEPIAFLILCFFIVPDVVYHYFLLDVRSHNHWVIYLLYNVVNVVILYKLKKLNAHLIISIILAINVLLNIVVSFYFVSSLIPQSVYNYYPYPARTLMIASLCYLGMLQNGAKFLNVLSNNSNGFGTLFRRGSGLGF